MSSTSGPALSEDGTINVGVGAHIAAASPRGPRYGANMKPAERSSGANGIWLCQSCSKLIDSDENRYTVSLLHEWKKDAIQRALDAIVSGRPLGTVTSTSVRKTKTKISPQYFFCILVDQFLGATSLKFKWPLGAKVHLPSILSPIFRP